MDNKILFRVARRAWLFAWLFFAVYLAAIMGTAYGLGESPTCLGLPLWIAISCIGVPFLFVLLLILLIERIIPDIPLTKDEEHTS